ncbi:SSL2 DNA or RNA helicases of superfamily II [uncultured Caudovirales phage]|uniref:SSL2 DNA or RNA helicases of superfamily II n=1 Tax=uncultured Caudovirales phage TaxID=2100421 RepID=A0A6J5LFJ4_9CAUD|nr:SSL2 DNA or RNA helicases of superfamily II [uncultured Caudovirales phage]
MDSNLIISKKDEVYVKITCERHFAQELSEFFTFFVPGYTFVPAYRNKIWDGKIRLFNLQSSTLYRGLLPYVESFCKEREYTYEFQDNLDVEDEFSVYHANKFFDSLNLHSNGKPIKVRDHQVAAFCHAMQKRRTLLLSPTASGKSLIIYTIFRQLLDYQGLKGLIIVPTTSLVEQLYSDFADYSSETDFSVEDNVHRIYQGKDKQTNKNLVISTWQSLYKMPKEYFDQFDYVIGDEAHQFKAQSLTGILTSCSNTKYRIGLTGTLDGTKTHKLVLEGLFGTVKRVITTKELIDKNELARFEIKCLILKHSDTKCEWLKGKTYQDEINYLVSNNQRNKFIKNLAVSLGKNTLILYQLVDKHGQLLYDLIKETKNLGDRKVFYIHGKTDVEDREKIRKIMEIENNAIVVASVGTFSTGVNIRNLHNIIFASPSKARIRTLQSIGRGLRQSEGKEVATLYDIADDLRFKKHMNFTLKHFVERVKIYTEEKFPYKIYKIGLKDD